MVEDDLDFVKDCYYPEEIVVPSRMEQIRRESVDVKKLERQSAGSKDAEGGAVVVAVHFVAVVVAAAVSDSEVESMPPVKQVEVGTVVPAIPMNSDPKPMSAKEEAAAVAAVGFESGAAGPILRSDQPWKKLLGGWSYSIAAIAESTVAAEDWNCQEAPSHEPPYHYEHRFLQTLH